MHPKLDVWYWYMIHTQVRVSLQCVWSKILVWVYIVQQCSVSFFGLQIMSKQKGVSATKRLQHAKSRRRDCGLYLKNIYLSIVTVRPKFWALIQGVVYRRLKESKLTTIVCSHNLQNKYCLSGKKSGGELASRRCVAPDHPALISTHNFQTKPGLYLKIMYWKGWKSILL